MAFKNIFGTVGTGPKTNKQKKPSTKIVSGSDSKGFIAYRTDYKIDLPLQVRKKIISAKSNYLCCMNIHFRSNLSRIEYEIDKMPHLKRLLDSVPKISRYSIFEEGFIIWWDNNYASIRCAYLTNGYRKYKIYIDNMLQYEKELDSPIVDLNDDLYDFEDDDDSINDFKSDWIK